MLADAFSSGIAFKESLRANHAVHRGFRLSTTLNRAIDAALHTHTRGKK
jgi:hypothetical protein